MSAARRGCYGFTLIEAMVTVAIVAILAAICYPSYTGFIRKGWRAEARSALMRQMQAQERYFTAQGRYSAYHGDSGDSGAPGRYLIESGNCEGRSNIDSCVRLTAKLKAGLSDPQVSALWIDSIGNRGCVSALPDACWP